MHHLAAKQVLHFMLLFDVREAHRVVSVREEDWGTRRAWWMVM